MSKKKIAVFSTGWSCEILYQYLNGFREGMKDTPSDIYLFLSHAVYGAGEQYIHGEMNIYELPDMRDFDASLVFANGLDYPETLAKINKKSTDAGIPVFYTGKDIEGLYYVGSDNYIGTKQMAEHLVNVHNVKKVWFIAGSQENMDSNVRLQAVRDVLGTHSYPLSEEDICYSQWSPYIAYNYVIDRLKKGNELPDAIICANDTLAMVICSELRKNGLKVPDDVIITGFDNDMLAQVYDPSISSIDQRFDNIGRKTAEMLINIFNGEQSERTCKVSCEFVPSESCGCTSAKDFNAIRRRIGRDKFEDRIYQSNFDIKLSNIERLVLQGRTFHDLGSNLEQLNKIPTEYEKNSFHVIFDPLYERTISEQQRPLRQDGYPSTMNVIFSKDQGLTMVNTIMETRQLLPQNNSMTGNRIFLFLPLHDEQYEIGYLVFGDDLEKLKDGQLLRKYVERFNIIIGKFYQNLRLDTLNQRLLQMTETDALTHVKNRTAFETRLGALQTYMQSELKPYFAFALFDVNNLKRINDNLGHEAGDEYIINSCRLICRTFKKSAVYRIGGDEFVAVLENEDYINRDTLLKQMKDEMEALKSADLPVYEKISIASGMAVYDPEKDFNISDVFNRADNAMYENKAFMKQQS